jgi:catechol 2,3-dioxygenase-like lactoylglutathione lyase family enzyme
MENKWILFIFCLFGHHLLFAQNSTSIKGIHHVSMVVRNLDSAKAFYQKMASLQSVQADNKHRNSVFKKSNIDIPAHQTGWLQGPNAWFELLAFKSANGQKSQLPVQGPGFTHFCYQTPQNNLIFETAKNQGADVVSRNGIPVDRGFGILYAYLRDPDGILFEVEQLAKVNFSEATWLGHIAIVTPDIDRLVEFYTQLLGKKPHNRIDNIQNSPKLDAIANMDGLRLRGAWFKLDNMILEIWQFDNPPTPKLEKPKPFTEIGYQKIAFEVGDLAQELKRVAEYRFNFLTSKPVQALGAKSILLRDPDGNLLQLLQTKSSKIPSLDALKKLTW